MKGVSAASRLASSTSWLLPQPPFSGAGEGALTLPPTSLVKAG
jgi:hypothetical protein